MSHQLNINIYGSTIRVQSRDASSLDVLAAEFHYFLRSHTSTPDFILTLIPSAPPAGLLPALAVTRISKNSITYDEGPRRWNDYFGKALSCYDYGAKEGVLYSADPDRMHEIAYLMVLSLTGKDLDLRGWHKVHACAIRYKGRDAVIMLPSGGGKTTLLLELARLPGVALLSDDTPLVDELGRVHPFPLRIGVEHLPGHLAHRQGEFHLFHRQHYCDKWLIPLDQLGPPIAEGPSAQVLLLMGRRHNDLRPVIFSVGPLTMLRGLIEHMVVGIGLPMVVEYFIRHTWRDWGTLARVALKRAWAAVRLQQHSRSFVFVMGTDPALNARALLEQMERP
jgi:hypothetical protein